MKLQLEDIQWMELSGEDHDVCLLFKISIEDSVVFHKAPILSLICWKKKNTDWLDKTNHFLRP